MTSRANRVRRTTSAVLLLVAVAGGASALDAPPNPIPLYLQGLDVAPGVEHRLVVLHPILAQPQPGRHGDQISLGGLATPDILAFGKMERSSSPHVDALSLTAGPSLLLAGDVLRTDVADFAVRREVVLDGGAPQSMALVRVSRETAPDPKVAEPAMLGPVLPSAIRFLLLDGAPAAEIRETCGKWAEDVHLASDRMSPAELPSAELVRKRAADYRKSFADLFKRPPTGGREAVGVVVLFEGALASFETFADGKSFAAAWPRLLDGIATEAVVLEARQRSLEIDIPDPADPDRFLSDMKQKLLGVYGARPVERDLLDSGRHLEFALDAATARALVRGDNQVVHFVLLTDPARRGEKRPSEDPDLNAARRKLRPTEEEKRRLERHDDPPPPPK